MGVGFVIGEWLRLIVVRLRRRQETVDLAALADGSLPADRRAELQARVAASPELADRLAEQERAVALAQGAAAGVQAPDRLRARVDAQRNVRRSRAPRRVVLALAATAAVAAAVVVALGVLGSSPGTKRFHAALGPTPSAPGASGEANLVKTSSGWRIELDARGLPRLDGGRFYEAWLRDPAGVLVPVGTFNEGRKVTLWAGVRPTDYPTLTVTRERADGDQASSGDRVLVGKITESR
jgi:Anti-sigma-K factor rskA, C-terminal